MITIQGRLVGLNEYTSENRKNRYAGAKMKAEMQTLCKLAILHSKIPKVINYPISIEITWHELNARRDIDNITFATKFILDALVARKIIIDDSQKYVKRIAHEITVDKNNPRIEIEIKEKQHD